MKKIILAIIIITLQSCIEKEGYYNAEQNQIISLICDTTWARDKIINNDGTTYQDTYNFQKDGILKHLIITTNKEGKENNKYKQQSNRSFLLTLHLIPFILVISTTGT